MINASHAAMQEALKQRRNKGLDLTIFIGSPDETTGLVDGDDMEDADAEKEREELGTAPEATPLTDEKPDDENLVTEGELAQASDPAAHPDEAMDKALIESALQKNDLLGPGSMARRMKKTV